MCTLWTYRVEKEHHEHIEHIKHEHGGELPPVPEYDYLNKRGAYYRLYTPGESVSFISCTTVKPFPWGNNSLFFNPEVREEPFWLSNPGTRVLNGSQVQKNLDE